LESIRKARHRVGQTKGYRNKIRLILFYVHKVSDIVLYEYLLRESKRVNTHFERCLHDKEMAARLMNTISLSPIPASGILDAGCGRGRISGMFSLLGSKTVGFDIEKHDSWHGIENEGFLVADIQNMPFRSSCFDLCTNFLVLTEVRDDEKALREISRVLKPGSTFIISVTNRCNLKSRFTRRMLYQKNVREYDRDQITRLLKGTGFRIRSIKTAVFYSPILRRVLSNLLSDGVWEWLGRLLPEEFRGVILLHCAKCTDQA